MKDIILAFATIGDQIDGIYNSDLIKILTNIFNTILIAVGLGAVIAIIYGGFLVLMSRGDSSKVSRGKTVILGSFIGLLIVFCAFAIVKFATWAMGKG